jgi:hypothetical protein
MSASGSLIDIANTPYVQNNKRDYKVLEICIYQLDLVTPVISPLDASLRKQILQTPNFRMNALGRPQRGHLLYLRTENLGFRCAFAMMDFLAKPTSKYFLFKIFLK